MPGARDLVIKPAFMNEIHALPAKVMVAALEKIKGLAHDPTPDGLHKIKLAEPEGVYRLRVGDYRVLYSFGDQWIRLLAIRHRKEAYSQKHAVTHEVPGPLPPEPEVPLPAEDEAPPGARVTIASPPVPGDLPRPITREWLDQLKVPAEYHAALCACTGEDALLAAPVPPWVLERVVDNLWPRPLAEVVQQPDFTVADPDDLQRYKDGDLFGFLLQLDDEQAHVVDWRLRGPAIIKGGPGTGKSTVALYRVRSLLDHAAATGQPVPRILFTTYTNALTRSSEQLLRHLLGDRADRVTVSTADRLARTVVERVETAPAPADPQTLASTLTDVRRRPRPPGRKPIGPAMRSALDKLRTDYLLAEFEWMIEGRSLATADEYRHTDRTGRGVALPAGLRAAVWDLYQDFQAELARRNLTTFGAIRRRALEIVRAGRGPDRFDAVIIDEAQDLTPTALSLLAETCRDPAGLYLTADASQSLYARGFSWRQVHDRLQFRGRTALLKRNYRTSREITAAAVAFLRAAEAGDPDCLNLECVHTGPMPVLLSHTGDAEQWQQTADFIRAMTRRFRLQPHAAAVLAPTNALADQAATELTRAGLPARFVRGGDLDLQAQEVKVFTLHSAKGLEFPVVAIVGLREGTIPRLRDHTPEEAVEETQVFRRLLYVGMTRAMRALMMTYPAARPSPFVGELAAGLWVAEVG